jgi:hypothetical protein
MELPLIISCSVMLFGLPFPSFDQPESLASPSPIKSIGPSPVNALDIALTLTKVANVWGTDTAPLYLFVLRLLLF